METLYASVSSLVLVLVQYGMLGMGWYAPMQHSIELVVYNPILITQNNK